jgi:hypothetical protein
VKERWGILQEDDSTRGRISQPSEQIILHDRDWPMLGEGLAHLSENGSPPPISEYQLTSQPYNKVRWINGHSQAVIRVSDGAPLFDTDVTILQVSRTDWAWEWARSSFHGIVPLPWKEYRVAMGIVTSTEIALIEDLKKFMPGIAIRYLVTDGFMYSHDRYSRIIRPKMQEAIEQFSGAP